MELALRNIFQKYAGYDNLYLESFANIVFASL